jgi:uncharacterized protein YfaS (alpha-2-macroglobulin family)
MTDQNEKNGSERPGTEPPTREPTPSPATSVAAGTGGEGAAKNVFARAFAFVARVLTAVVGTWAPPPWVHALRRTIDRIFGARLAQGSAGVRKHKKPILVVVGLLVVAAWGIPWIQFWIASRPGPPWVTISVVPPGPTPLDGKNRFQPLTLTFSNSGAPLEAVGKPVDTGIALSPPLAGQWTWANDRTLRFVPTADWDIDTEYRVELDENVISDTVRVDQLTYTFNTARFEMRLGNADFYQNPLDASEKKLVATLVLNYPVDKASLEKRIAVTLIEERPGDIPDVETKVGFSVRYDEHGGAAHVHSDTIALPKNDQRMKLVIDEGVKSSRGGRAREGALETGVHVPGLYSFFKVASADAQWVDDENDRPRLALLMRFTDGVTLKNVERHIEAWMLPTDRPAQEKRPLEKNFGWHNDAEISPTDLAAGTKLHPLVADPILDPSSKMVSFALEGTPNRVLFIRVKKGLRSEGGYELPEDVEHVVYMPPLDIKLAIAHDGGILALSGERSLSVVSRGLSSMKTTIGRVISSEVNHLITQTNGDLNQLQFRENPYGYGGEYDESGGYDDSDAETDEGENGNDEGDESGHEGDVDDGYAGGLGSGGHDYDEGYGYAQPTSFGEENITDRFEFKRALERTNDATPQYSSLDLSPYLKSDGQQKPGLFFVRIDGHAPDGRVLTVKRFVLVTDLGVLTKQGADGSFDVYVQSFATGQPTSGAQVSVLTKNGRSLTRATTTDGHVHFKKFAGKGPLKPIAFLVQSDTDISFVPLDRRERRLNLSRFDVGGVRATGAKDELTAFVFSDRGIYRPGEEIDLAAIARSRKLDVDVTGLLVQTDIRDSKNRLIHEQNHKLENGGLIAFRAPTEQTSPTGTYTATVRLLEKQKSGKLKATRQLGSTLVRVEEFLPDTMKVSARLSDARQNGWVSPDSLTVAVTLENLFGAPASDRVVRAKAHVSPVSPWFSAHEGFQFFARAPLHGTRESRHAYTTSLGELSTDAAGQVTFPIDLSGARAGLWSVTVEAEGFDAGGGRSVTAFVTTNVSPQKAIVGVRTDGDLSFLPRESARTIELIAVDGALEKIAKDALELVIEEDRYVSVLVEKTNGTLGYQSERRVVERSRAPLSISKDGNKLSLDTTTAGNFRLTVREGDELLATVAYTVAGQANVSRHMEKNAELELKLAKSDADIGEDLEIHIKAPYVGAGLITIEGDTVHAHKWFQAKTTSTIERITVPAGIEGNAYVHVTVLRDAASREIHASPLSTGVLPFSLSRKARTVALTLEQPKRARPGEEIVFRVSADKPARAVVFAVDEGILQVAHHQPPNPIAHFFQKRALQVTTWQLLDLLLPEASISRDVSASGGGDDEADAAVGANLNPFQRKTKKPVVMWSGVVDVGPGVTEHRLRVPDDFNGGLRVMAVASSKAAIGAAHETVRVRGDIVLSTTAPLFAAPGDIFTVSVGVSNQIEGSGDSPTDIVVEANASPHLTITSKESVTVQVGERREAKARFEVRVNDVLGGAELTFIAKAKGLPKGLRADPGKGSATLSVRPASPYLTTLVMGQVTDGERRIPLDRVLYPHLATREVQLGAVPLTVAKGLYRYVSDFPFGCTEQLISRSMAAMLLHDIDGIGVKRSVADTMMATTKSALRFRQTESGAFGVWAANATQNPHHTVYAAHYMLEAKERGYTVDNDVLQSALRYLTTLAGQEPRSLHDARLSAYALYVLARSGKVVTKDLEALVDVTKRAWPKEFARDLFSTWAAGTYAVLKNDRAARTFLAKPVFGSGLLGSVYFTDTLAWNTQTLYVVARHFKDELPNLVDAKGLEQLLEPLQRSGYNTLSSAYAILALRAYVDAIGGFSADDKTATVRVPLGMISAGTQVGGQPLVELHELVPHKGAGKGGEPREQSRMLSIADGAFPTTAYSTEATAIALKSRMPTPLYYQVTHAGFDKAPPDTPIKDKIEVTREFTKGGVVVNKATVGDDITVHIKVRVVHEKGTIPDIAIVDLLPAGFEIDLESGRQALPTPGVATMSTDFVDLREDRALVFTSISDVTTAYAYTVKVTTPGTLVVPPPQAMSMYDLTLRGRGVSSTIEVAAP